MMLLIINILLCILCVSSYKFTTKINSITYDYEIPKWVYKRKIFKQNKIPRFSKYYKKRKIRMITEEEAEYNAIKICNLPFGLLQKNM